MKRLTLLFLVLCLTGCDEKNNFKNQEIDRLTNERISNLEKEISFLEDTRWNSIAILSDLKDRSETLERYLKIKYINNPSSWVYVPHYEKEKK